jgi:hypothetical protein
MAAVFVAVVVMSTDRGPKFGPEAFPGVLIGATANPNANPNATINPAKTFTISGSVVDLYPGAHKTLTLRFDNPLNQDIRVQTANVTVQSTTKPGCATSTVTPTNYTAPSGGGVFVSKKSSATVDLPISMGTDSQNACSGATFSLAYTGTAVQA